MEPPEGVPGGVLGGHLRGIANLRDQLPPQPPPSTRSDCGHRRLKICGFSRRPHFKLLRRKSGKVALGLTSLQWIATSLLTMSARSPHRVDPASIALAARDESYMASADASEFILANGL